MEQQLKTTLLDYNKLVFMLCRSVLEECRFVRNLGHLHPSIKTLVITNTCINFFLANTNSKPDKVTTENIGITGFHLDNHSIFFESLSFL